MKKNYTYYLSLLSIPILALLFLNNAGGKTGGFSGSPGDGFANCAQCHSGGNFSAIASITTNIPAAGFAASTTYDVTVSVSSESTKHGFQLTAEDASNTKVGSFTAGTGSQVVNGGTHVTHTSGGTSQTSWTFQWTAPASAEGNQVTFYAAVNATNANGGTSGDQVVTTSTAVNQLGLSDYNQISFSIHPNPSTDYIKFSTADFLDNDTELTITNYQGQIIKKLAIDANFDRLDVSDLSNGIYFIHITSGNKLGVSKFIKN